MNEKESDAMLFAGVGAFLAVLIIAAVLSWPHFGMKPRAKAESEPSVAQTGITMEFPFTNEELLDGLAQEFGQPLYRGTFFDHATAVDWAVFNGSDDPAFYAPVKVAAYRGSEEGPTELLRIRGYRGDLAQGINQDRALQYVLQQCREFQTLDFQDIKRDLAANQLYTEFSAWILSQRTGDQDYTLRPKHGFVPLSAADGISWENIYPFASDVELRDQIIQWNREYRHDEMAKQLKQVASKKGAEEDPFLKETLSLAQQAALVESRCEEDRTYPAKPVFHYHGIVGVTDAIAVVPRLTSSGVSVEAGFYGDDLAPFTKVILEINGESAVTESCPPSTIEPLENGRFLKTTARLFYEDASQQEFRKAETPVLQFFSAEDILLYEHPVSAEEKRAFDNLCDLYRLKTLLYQRMNYYEAFLKP